MRNIPTNLYNEIQEGNICNILKITLQSGAVHAYTDFDQNITVGGVTYIPAPGLQKVKMTLTNTSEVSNQELASAWVDAPEADMLGGKFDLADVKIGWASWKHPEYGSFDVFTGKLGELSWTDAGFKADIFSNMKDLEKTIGEVFTANCRHQLFSQTSANKIGSCKVNPSSFTTTGSVSSIIKNRWKFATNVSAADNFYASGKITFTSGNNNGLSFVVKNQIGGTIELFLPTSFIIQAGDTFSIQAGCDKTLATCKAKFNNVANFGGFPHIQPDVSFR